MAKSVRVVEVGEEAVEAIERQDWLDRVGGVLDGVITGVFERAGNAGRHVKNFLHGTWLGHPLHPALTDVPLGAWTTALVLDALDRPRAWDGRGAYSAGADAAIAIGAAGAVAAATAGLVDCTTPTTAPGAPAAVTECSTRRSWHSTQRHWCCAAVVIGRPGVDSVMPASRPCAPPRISVERSCIVSASASIIPSASGRRASCPCWPITSCPKARSGASKWVRSGSCSRGAAAPFTRSPRPALTSGVRCPRVAWKAPVSSAPGTRSSSHSRV